MDVSSVHLTTFKSKQTLSVLYSWIIISGFHNYIVTESTCENYGGPERLKTLLIKKTGAK